MITEAAAALRKVVPVAGATRPTCRSATGTASSQAAVVDAVPAGTMTMMTVRAAARVAAAGERRGTARIGATTDPADMAPAEGALPSVTMRMMTVVAEAARSGAAVGAAI